jgi:hypothetical protein
VKKQLIVPVLFLLLLSCSIDDRDVSSETRFKPSDRWEEYISTRPFVFSESFFQYESLRMEGVHSCSLIVNGDIDTIFEEPIAYEILASDSDTTMVDPLTGQSEIVTPIVHDFYVNNLLVESALCYYQVRPEGFYLLFWKNSCDSVVTIPEEKRLAFPDSPVAGLLTDDDGNEVVDNSNRWSSAPYNPVFKNFEGFPSEWSNSYAVLNGTFALELLGQEPYSINGKNFVDGIDMHVYHSSRTEHTENGEPVITSINADERHAVFKMIGLRELEISVVTEKQFLRQRRYELRKESFSFQFVRELVSETDNN